MASQWFYSFQGTKFGPISTDELKALAASNQVKPNDLVWRNGMAQWVAASTLNKLFPAPSEAGPPPLPNEAFVASSIPRDSIGTRLKAAGKLAAAQAHRTKLTTITLPQAYRNLGRHIQKSGQFRDELPDLFNQSDELAANVSAIASTAAERPTVEGFAGKAKATALAAKDMAQSKGTELRIAQIMGRIGQAAFEKHGDQCGPVEITRPIADARSQVTLLDEQITALSNSKSNDPSQLRFTQKPVFVAITLSLLYPLGLFFLWKQPSWSKVRKWTIAAVAGVFFVAVVINASQQAGKAKANLAKADDLWTNGKTAQAADIYATLIDDDLEFLSKSDESRAFGRLIDLRVEQNGPEAGRDFVDQAIRLDLPLSLATDQANSLYADEKEKQRNSQKLSADYLPFRPGARAGYEIFGGGVTLHQVWDFQADGIIKVTLMSMSGPDGQGSHYLNKPIDDEKYSVDGNFIELGNDTKETSFIWQPLIKIDAKVGDRWQSRETAGIVYQYSLQEFGTYSMLSEQCSDAVIHEDMLTNGKTMASTDYVVVKNIGLVEKHVHLDNGETVTWKVTGGGASNTNLTDAERLFFK